MSFMSSFARNFAPQLKVQHAAAPVALLSLQAWFIARHSSSSTSTAAGTPVDIFTEKLQQKTEQEIIELLQGGRDQAGVAEKQAEEEQDAGAITQDDTGEIGGPKGPEPTRFGDWEVKGRISDF